MRPEVDAPIIVTQPQSAPLVPSDSGAGLPSMQPSMSLSPQAPLIRVPPALSHLSLSKSFLNICKTQQIFRLSRASWLTAATQAHPGSSWGTVTLDIHIHHGEKLELEEEEGRAEGSSLVWVPSQHPKDWLKAFASSLGYQLPGPASDLVQEDGRMENYQVLSWGQVRGMFASVPKHVWLTVPYKNELNT